VGFIHTDEFAVDLDSGFGEGTIVFWQLVLRMNRRIIIPTTAKEGRSRFCGANWKIASIESSDTRIIRQMTAKRRLSIRSSRRSMSVDLAYSSDNFMPPTN
jgi:hypothetical protein